MTNSELMGLCAGSECPTHTDCDLCMYMKGKADAFDELAKKIKSYSIALTFIDDRDMIERAIDNIVAEVKEQK